MNRLLGALSLAVLATATAGAPSAHAAATSKILNPVASGCADLAGMKIGARRIGLPTRGADILTAQMLPARTESGDSYGAHCKISGRIRPVDTNAPDIRFEVRLPVNWNGKALMMGGGGFNGSIPKLDANPYNALPGAPSALARGYALFGSDSGHEEDKDSPAKFMLNSEAYRNFMGDALKKTRDAAMAVITKAYGRKPDRSYFLGGSMGGREALAAVGRWPEDWNGAIVLYPARNQINQVIGGMGINQAFAKPGAFISRGKRQALFSAALEACDALDGLGDGIISAVGQCNAKFNPVTAALKGASLRCPSGADTGDTCLSDIQIAALRTMNGEQKFGFRLAGSDDAFPGYNVYTSDTGVPKEHPLQNMVTYMGLGALPTGHPAQPGMSIMVNLGEQFARFAFAGGAAEFNPLLHGPADMGRYTKAAVSASRFDIPERNLAAFARKGGKLLLMHGTADLIVSPRSSEQLYATLKQTMGADTVAAFLRFYLVPGMGHAISSDFMGGWDYLSALENWVEKGKDPGDSETIFDLAGVPGRSRPLCQYPAFPRYDGSGDATKAASFRCATE